jgi:glycosyltransferase involved in cell wall biosynthesis
MSALPGRALVIVENLSVPFDRRVWQECQTLTGHGWEVEVICPLGTKRDTETEVVIDGVRIHRYPLEAATGGPQGYLKEYGTALRHTSRLLKRIQKRAPVDVVHLCNPPDLLFLAALRAKLGGARVVFDQHDLVPELYLSRFRSKRDSLYWAMRALEWATYRTADTVIATNESYRAVATGRGRVPVEDTFVVRSAPAVERFRRRAAEPALAHGREHLLCYLGVMGPQDGVDYAVRALADLAARRDDWHAVFMGTGDAFDDVVALSRSLGLDDRVTFTGRVSDEDVLRYLSTASVCLAPDPRNPLNDVSTMNKIMEYMAMARPVVSFDLVEARVSAGDAAVYARPNDVSEFASLVSDLLDDPERRAAMGEIGVERVSGPLSWANSEKELLAAYEWVARDRRARVRDV